MEPSEFWSSVGVCQPFFEPVSSLDWEPLWCCLPLVDLKPVLLERDSLLHLSCMVCKASSLLASQSRYSRSLFQGLAISIGVSIVLGVWIDQSTTFRVSGSSLPLLSSRGGDRVLRPDLNLASAMRTQGSKHFRDRGGSWGAGVVIGKTLPSRKPSPLQEHKVFALRFLIWKGVHRKMVITRMYLRVRCISLT